MLSCIIYQRKRCLPQSPGRSTLCSVVCPQRLCSNLHTDKTVPFKRQDVVCCIIYWMYPITYHFLFEILYFYLRVRHQRAKNREANERIARHIYKWQLFLSLKLVSGVFGICTYILLFSLHLSWNEQRWELARYEYTLFSYKSGRNNYLFTIHRDIKGEQKIPWKFPDLPC